MCFVGILPGKPIYKALYRDYFPFTKYHGHPTRHTFFSWCYAVTTNCQPEQRRFTKFNLEIHPWKLTRQSKNSTISVDISPIKSKIQASHVSFFLGGLLWYMENLQFFFGSTFCASSNHFGLELKVPLTWRAGCCDTSLVIWMSGTDFWREYTLW